MKTAYPQFKTPVTLTLYSNVPFDNTYSNHSLISELFKYNNSTIYNSLASRGIAKERFLNRWNDSVTPHVRYYPRFELTGEYNFDYSNGLLASVVLELTAEQTNANYLRVKVGDGTNFDYYYYFITGYQQINVDTYKLSLELDVLMTYQDEFLEGMKDMPAFTTRKHCHRYTDDGLMPHCADLKTGEDTFANVKPTLIKSKFDLDYWNSEMKNIQSVMWLYICLDTSSITGVTEDVIYTCKNKSYPLIMMALPLNVNNVTYCKTDNTKSITYSHHSLIDAITSLIDDGSVHGARISPYPPFAPRVDTYKMALDNSNNLTIKGEVTAIAEETDIKLYQLKMGNNKLLYGDFDGVGMGNKIIDLLNNGALLIQYQDDTTYEYDELTPTELGFANTNAPTITSNRYQDPKLLFSPFKKYKITTQYANEGSEFFPELIFSEYETTTSGHYFWFNTIATAYIGDNNFYTYVDAGVGVSTFDNYRYEKIGLASAVNYIMPCGTNALDVFNSTQAQSFYTSKVASGITSGLSILGGAGSIALGVAGMATPEPFLSKSMGVGLIAGGATAIGSGIAGIATAVKSADAKIEDLKNTPDSVNVSGSNFITDENVASGTNGHPYIIVYDVSSAIKENADDFFYNFGYQVARECYFNTELKFTNNLTGKVDNNLFGRTIFNYVKLNEDITNKINYNMPLIVKQKLSKIFNDGITLWTFFGNGSLWGNESISTSNDPDKWFLKCLLDNTEYSGS